MSTNQTEHFEYKEQKKQRKIQTTEAATNAI